MKLGFYFLFMGVLLGCQTSNHPPKWIANPYSIYPENKFLVSVGEGDTRRSAENAADANLARIFGAQIESSERVFDQSIETIKTFERTTDFSTDINIHSSQMLYNINHAEAWQDSKGRIHAVAFLNRRKTAEIYCEKIDTLANKVQFYIAQSATEKSLLKKYAALRVAARKANEVSSLLRQLKTIHAPSMESARPSYNVNTIQKELAETAKKIRVQIHLSGDVEERMETVLEEIVSHYGFVLGHTPLLKIDGKITVANTKQRTGNLVFVRYTFSIHFKTSDGTTLLTLHEKGREGHVSFEEARVRVFRTLEQRIRPKVIQQMDAHLDALIVPE